MSATLETLEPGRVLFVDADPSILAAMVGLDFAFETAQTLEDAAAALRFGCFDIVLTDCGMLAASRLDLVQLVNERFPGVIVIVLAGANLAEVKRLETPQSIVRLLPRPYDAKRLNGWVNSTVRLARMSQVTGLAATVATRPRTKRPPSDQRPEGASEGTEEKPVLE